MSASSAAPEGLSANARKLQEEEIERLVKCRLRSEIEARKAVEATMKRAVHETRELKKELVLLRQEKEELRGELEARKHAVSTPSSDTKKHDETSAVTAAATKAAEKKFQSQIQKLTAELADWKASYEQLKSDTSDELQEKSELLTQRDHELKQKAKEMAALEDELKKVKLVSEDTKRKYQKAVKEKKEDLQKTLLENEHLARCKETLERQLELLPQLKKQLQYAKDKQSGVAEDWQKRLEQREQAFLRQEEDNKRELAAKQQVIVQLEHEKEELRAQLDELTSNVYENEVAHETKQRQDAEKFELLVASTKALQEKLLAAMQDAKEAQATKQIAEETLAQESRLRQMADDAADAVEARALKLEAQLEQLQQQLVQLEKALKARGITLDYLLKTPSGTSSNNNRSSKDEKADTPEGSSSRPAARREKTTTTVAKPRPVSSARDPVAAKPKAALSSTATTLKPKVTQPHTTATAAKPGAAKALPMAKKAFFSQRMTNSNNNDAERDGTPERTRRG
uniref:Uncharacterized protein n=1 Tax=Globisporangium ultimum (strain ATCC 200006 / CBS 805.95 / DAOM BR144) TaxID=431595 RepID=K3X8H3_GLOUD